MVAAAGLGDTGAVTQAAGPSPSGRLTCKVGSMAWQAALVTLSEKMPQGAL